MMTSFTSKHKLVSARILMRSALMIVVMLTVVACGIKPGQLEPPSGKGAPAYPGTYPKPQ